MTTKNNALRCRPERSEGSLASNLWRKAFEQQPVKLRPSASLSFQPERSTSPDPPPLGLRRGPELPRLYCSACRVQSVCGYRVTSTRSSQREASHRSRTLSRERDRTHGHWIVLKGEGAVRPWRLVLAPRARRRPGLCHPMV